MPQCGQNISGDADLKACIALCTDAPASGSGTCLAERESWAYMYILLFHSNFISSKSIFQAIAKCSRALSSRRNVPKAGLPI